MTGPPIVANAGAQPARASQRAARFGGWVLLFVVTLTAAAQRELPPGECPQPRFTGQAPPALYHRVNPLAANQANLLAGEALYHELLRPACADCHGRRGAGDGPLAKRFDPRPRNFACRLVVNGIPDGQLHWIIENGSPATAMPSYGFLSDEEIWQLVLYLRRLAE